MAEGFQEHHNDPKKLLQSSNIDLLKDTSITLIPFTPKNIILQQFITFILLHFSQITHKYAHYINHATDTQKNTLFGKILIFLQDNNIIISPKTHKTHHMAKNHDINF
jgi:hypothetical protein